MGRPKILFVINSLGGGGAERLLQTLSVEMCRRGVEVEILTLEHGESPYAFPVQVRVRTLWSAFLNRGPMKILALPVIALELRLRLLFRRPDAVMALLFRANFALALMRLFGYRGRIVVSDHADILGCYPGGGRDRVMRGLAALLYRWADDVVAVSRGVAESLVRIGLPRETITTIYNAVDLAVVASEAAEAPDLPSTLVSVGRLSHEKNHALLLEAFSDVRVRVPQARLLIVGDGPMRGALRALICELGLTDSVELLGWQGRPYSVVGRAKGFVLCSSFEGFGLVLVEAMAAGLPVISTDCPSGPAEILGFGEHGLLVRCDDRAALALAMLTLLEDEEVSHRLQESGFQRCQVFDVKRVCDEYLTFLL